MNYLKTHTTGIDIPIQSFQIFMYGALKKVWGISNDTDFDLYGRAHNNPRDSGFVPEAYNGNGGYTELLFNDQKKVGQGFFVAGGNEEYRLGTVTGKVGMVLMLNMKGILGANVTQMQDEQINMQVMKLAAPPRGQYTVTGLVKRIDNIFSEYPQWKDTVKFTDMFPYHCLRIDLSMMYNIYQCGS